MSDMPKYCHIFIVAFLLLISAWTSSFAGNNSGAAFSTWPDTGQRKCYNNTIEIPCPAPGQPFYGQDAHYNGPARSYALLGGGTMVQDNITGLIWEMKNSMDGIIDYSNPNDADNTYTWCDTNPDTNGGNVGAAGANDTKNYIDQLNSSGGFGGYTNWRIPTIKELTTLVDLGRHYPAVDPIFTVATRPSYYQSSTTKVDNRSLAWLVNFDDGQYSSGHKSRGHYVRAVRGGQSPSGKRFVDNGDGTVTDTITCLQWQKATMGTKNGVGRKTYNWQDALAASENLILAGHGDWRLPNKNELLSLVDYGHVKPAIDPVFPAMIRSNYWSSTFFSRKSALAWRVNFDGDGYDHLGSTLVRYYVRAVRSQQCGAIELGHPAYSNNRKP